MLGDYPEHMTPGQQFHAELRRIGAFSRPPATQGSVADAERRLGLRLPLDMAEFYLLGDGIEHPTWPQLWDFFPLAKLSRYLGADPSATLPMLDPREEPLAAASLVHFADALMAAPDYLFEGDPASPRYGQCFACLGGQAWLAARSFAEFVAAFVADSDDALLGGAAVP